jgi:glutamyl-tRNA synthetase
MEDLDAGKALIESEEYVRAVLPLVQERARTLVEVAELAQFFFIDQPDYEPQLLIGKGMDSKLTIGALRASQERLTSLPAFDADSLEGVLRPLAAELGLKTGQLFAVLRVAVTGRTAAPPLFATMAVLGRERCLKRIEAAIPKL